MILFSKRSYSLQEREKKKHIHRQTFQHALSQSNLKYGCPQRGDQDVKLGSVDGQQSGETLKSRLNF